MQRLTMAWRPDTWKRYTSSYLKFQMFCQSNDIDPTNCPLLDYLAYSEHLVQQGLAAATISNHLSALKTMCKWYGINQHLWETDHWKWNHRSIALSVRKPPKLKTVVTFPHFLQALHVCDFMKWPGVKMSFILGFLGLLRVSNLALHHQGALDPS